MKSIILPLALILLVSCAKVMRPEFKKTSIVNSQKNFNESFLQAQKKFLGEEFSYTCINCHFKEEYVEGEGTNNIFKRNFLLKSFYQAKYPEENWIIKKISTDPTHTTLCQGPKDLDCEALIISWIHTFKQSGVEQIQPKNGTIMITLSKGERLYLFDSFPSEINTLQRILKGPQALAISSDGLWGAALVSPSNTRLLEFKK